jgi:hypothetical protein
MKCFYLLVTVVLFLVNSVYSQSLDLGSWNIINIKQNFDQKWSVFAEGQLRSLKMYSHFHYYEYKGGFNFKMNKNIQFTIGAGSYQTYKEGGDFVLPKNNDEFRIWPQVNLHQTVGVFKIEQRYRAEFRFTNNGYRNRYRYRLGLLLPFGRDKDDYKPFQISASNELFFTDNEPYFERNRILIAFNYKPSKVTTLQIGYLHQFDYKINDETGRDFIQVGYFIELYRNNAQISKFENSINDN